MGRVAQNRDRTFWISEEWPDSRRISKNLKESQRISKNLPPLKRPNSRHRQRISKNFQASQSALFIKYQNSDKKHSSIVKCSKKRKEKRKPKKDKKKEKKKINSLKSIAS